MEKILNSNLNVGSVERRAMIQTGIKLAEKWSEKRLRASNTSEMRIKEFVDKKFYLNLMKLRENPL